MAIAFKSVQQASAGTSGATCPSLGAAAIGDLVVVALTTNGPGPATPTDSAGNTYTLIQGRNNGSTLGCGLYYSILTASSAGLTVSCNPSAPMSFVAALVSGVSAYNVDKAISADFGGSTAWTVGPSAGTPAANSIAFYIITADQSETAFPDSTGWNTTGANGFTSGMLTNAHQEIYDGTHVPVGLAYKMISAATSASVTLPASAVWFGTVASFAPAATGGTATKVLVSTQPAGAVSGATFTTQPTGTIADVSNVTVASSATVTAAITSGSGTLSGTTTVTSASGIWAFTNLKITGTGAHTLTFTSSGLTSAVSSSFTVSAASNSAYLGVGSDGADPGYDRAVAVAQTAVAYSGDRRSFTPTLPTGFLQYLGVNRAEYPRVYMNHARPTSPKSGGTTITCTTEAQLRAAIGIGGTAVPGDKVVVSPSVDVRGGLTLKTIAGDALPGGQNVITVIPSGWTLAEGVRCTSADKANMYKMTQTASANAPALTQDVGTGGGWRFIGANFRVDSSVTDASRTVYLGNGNSGTQTTSTIPYNFTAEQCYFESHNLCDTRRGFEPHARGVQILDCEFAGNIFTRSGIADSQAWDCWNTDGPLACINTKMAGGSETFCIGGGTNDFGVCADIEIWGNDCYKPLSWIQPDAERGITAHPTWDGIIRDTKNGIEIKKARRMLVQGNVIRDITASNQNGNAFLCKNELYGDFTTTTNASDVIFRWNICTNIMYGISATGFKNNPTDGNVLYPITDCAFYGNLFVYPNNQYWPMGDMAFFGCGVNTSYYHNTHICGNQPVGTWFQMDNGASNIYTDGKVHNLLLDSNIVDNNNYGIHGPDVAGRACLNTFTVGYSMKNNVLIGGAFSSGVYDGGGETNFYPAADANVGFVDYVGGTSYALNSNAGTAAALAITQQPSNGASGAAQATQPIVAVKDGSGVTVTTDSSTVTAALQTVTGTGTAVGTLTKAAVLGIADFASNGLGVTSAAGGTFKWRFTDGALTLADSSTFTISAAPVATAVVITTQPSGSVSGAPLSVQPRVEIRDQFGALFSTAVLVTATVASGTTSITAGSTATTSGGAVTFSGLTLTTAATNNVTLTFTATSLTTATSAAFSATGSVVAPGGSTGAGTTSTIPKYHHHKRLLDPSSRYHK